MAIGPEVLYVRADLYAAERTAREKAEKSLLIVQNAAKTLASSRDTELQHLRENAAYDHKLRAEHESLKALNSQLTDDILAAEAALSASQEEEKRAHDEAQRASFVRAFAPCEHGRVDFETCPECRGWTKDPTHD
jgi:hypothetical protein